MAFDMWENILYSSIALIIIIVIILLLFYVINMKNVSSQKKHFEKIHQELTVGKKVLILNAIYGEVSKVNGDTFDLKLKSGEIMEVSRYAISKIIN